MRKRSTFVMVLVAVGLALTGCADEPVPDGSNDGSNEGARLGLDHTIPCPEGEVGWRFPTEPLDPNSEEYVQRSGDSSVVEITERYAIELQSATCNGNASGEAGSLRNECGGSLTCQYSTSCGGNFTVSYTCGAADKAADGTQNTYSATASNGVVSLACSQPAEDAVEVETRTACVPRQCHGRARRNLDMECVEDPDALDVVMKGGFNFTYDNGFSGIQVEYLRFPIIERYTTIGDDRFYTSRTLPSDRSEYVFPGMEYSIGLYAEFWFGLAPERSSVVAWMSDRYEHKTTGETVDAFRCVAFKRDLEPENPETIGEDDAIFDLSYTGKFSEDCTEGGRVSEDTAAKKLGISVTEFRQDYSYYNTSLRASYDIEGNAVWHKVNKFRSFFTLEDLAYHEPECSPNPQDFYYDSTIGTYDLIGYYAQREFAEPLDLYFAEPWIGRKAYLFGDTINSNSDLTIRTTSRLNASLPVDISWSTVNLTKENPFNPFAQNVDIGGAWEPGRSLPSANFGPKNLRASVYVSPWGRPVRSGTRYNYKLGEIPLRSPNPQGTTQSVNLPITETIKRYFTRPPSEAYIAGDTALFELFYCIESDDDPRYAGDAFKTKKGVEYYDPGTGADFAVREYETNYVLTESASDPARPPFSLTLQRPCIRQTRPLRVNIDRFTTPVEPISAAGFTGSTNNESTGDEKMSGDNDNDNEINCMGQSQENCVEAVNSGTRTDGENGRSTYDLNSRLGRNPGDEASSSVTGEMLGFQLIDPMDPESSSVAFPADSAGAASTPVTLTLAPDWDTIAVGLNGATLGTTAEWKTGRYGGQLGLGVGWGYKWRFQIGPAPVLVTFTISVGASFKLQAEFQFGPGAGQEYPCIGDQSCIVKVSQPATFREASQQCNVLGGRLAELSSPAEATAVGTQRGGEDVWIGAQLAYRHDKPSCATNFVASECLSRSETQYRWMSNSVAFAQNTGDAAPSYVANTLYGANQSGLATGYPYDRAVLYRANGNLGVADVNTRLPFLCTYEPAAKERFFRWQLAINMGAAAGFRLEGCTPSDNPGFCLAASFNIVSFSIGPVFENIYHWLYRAGESDPYTRRGNTNISVPWALKLFEGAVTAAVNFLWFSISWNLVTYDGITAAEGSLFDVDIPVIESLE